MTPFDREAALQYMWEAWQRSSSLSSSSSLPFRLSCYPLMVQACLTQGPHSTQGQSDSSTKWMLRAQDLLKAWKRDQQQVLQQQGMNPSSWSTGFMPSYLACTSALLRAWSSISSQQTVRSDVKEKRRPSGPASIRPNGHYNSAKSASNAAQQAENLLLELCRCRDSLLQNREMGNRNLGTVQDTATYWGNDILIPPTWQDYHAVLQAWSNCGGRPNPRRAEAAFWHMTRDLKVTPPKESFQLVLQSWLAPSVQKSSLKENLEKAERAQAIFTYWLECTNQEPFSQQSSMDDFHLVMQAWVRVMEDEGVSHARALEGCTRVQTLWKQHVRPRCASFKKQKEIHDRSAWKPTNTTFDLLMRTWIHSNSADQVKRLMQEFQATWNIKLESADYQSVWKALVKQVESPTYKSNTVSNLLVFWWQEMQKATVLPSNNPSLDFQIVLKSLCHAENQGDLQERFELQARNLLLDLIERYDRSNGTNRCAFLPTTSDFNMVLAAFAQSGEAESAESLLQYWCRDRKHDPDRPNAASFYHVLSSWAQYQSQQESDSEKHAAAVRADATLIQFQRLSAQGKVSSRPDIKCFHQVMLAWSRCPPDIAAGTVAVERADAILQDVKEAFARENDMASLRLGIYSLYLQVVAQNVFLASTEKATRFERIASALNGEELNGEGLHVTCQKSKEVDPVANNSLVSRNPSMDGWKPPSNLEESSEPFLAKFEKHRRSVPHTSSYYLTLKEMCRSTATSQDRKGHKELDEVTQQHSNDIQAVPNTHECNIVLEYLAQKVHPEEAEHLLQEWCREALWVDETQQPNASSFKTVVRAWVHLSDSDKSSVQSSIWPLTPSNQSIAERAEAILRQWQRLSAKKKISSQPDADCFMLVLQAWSQSGSELAISHSERLLRDLQQVEESDLVKGDQRSFILFLKTVAESSLGVKDKLEHCKMIMGTLNQRGLKPDPQLLHWLTKCQINEESKDSNRKGSFVHRRRELMHHSG